MIIGFGAPGRSRTSTVFPPPDFESGASTSSATGARQRDHSREAHGGKRGITGCMDSTPASGYAAPMAKSIAMLIEHARTHPHTAAALAVAAVSAATLAGAWFFELVVGLDPCPLCLDQRVPYYIAVPLGIGLSWLATKPHRSLIVRAGLALLALVLLIGAGLGVYHAGIEWGWWAGPAGCAGGTLQTPVSDLLSALKSARVVPCDEAAWRFLGLSLAGWSAMIAGGLALVALAAARLPAHGSSSVSQ